MGPGRQARKTKQDEEAAGNRADLQSYLLSAVWTINRLAGSAAVTALRAARRLRCTALTLQGQESAPTLS